jgi:excisionase family DNA binding protein
MNPIHATADAVVGYTPAAFCTTREAADLLGISLRTAQMWVENGLLEGWKTPGGHRRILRSSLDKLLPVQVGAVAGTTAVPPAPTFGAADTTPAVLVVEDDPHLQRLFRLHLTSWQPLTRVFTASDGFEGLLRAGMERPQLIFADLLMPGMDGFRMIGALRSQPELAATRIIVITGLNAGEIAAQGHLPPDVEVLHKPIDFTLLKQRWQTLITASTATHAAA